MLCCMKQNSRKMLLEQQRVFELWILVTSLTLAGVYMGTWLFMLILKALLT